MDLSELIDKQRRFDSQRQTTFDWSAPITAGDFHGLLHNVLSLTGEAGEVANLVKKFDRGDFDFDHLLDELPGELADVLIYVLKISYQAGIDLERAIAEKMDYNEERFPVTNTSRDDVGPLSAVTERAKSLAISLPQKDIEAVATKFASAGVPVPTSVENSVVAMLLVIEVAKLADLEGNPGERDRRWRELESTARSVDLAYGQLVALTPLDAEIGRLLGVDGRPNFRS